MKIGAVAKAAGLGVDAVRFYERQGLIEEPRRRPSGYREYEPEVVLELRFIRDAKGLGFSLKEIRELLSLEADATARAADVRKLAQRKLRDIAVRIQSLQAMEQALRALVDGCPGEGPTGDCSILRALNREQTR